MFLDDDQLTVNKNELCLKIEDGDKTIEKSVSTFNPLLHLIEPEDKNSSLNYFKKLVKSRTYPQDTRELCDKEVNEISFINSLEVNGVESKIKSTISRSSDSLLIFATVLVFIAIIGMIVIILCCVIKIRKRSDVREVDEDQISTQGITVCHQRFYDENN